MIFVFPLLAQTNLEVAEHYAPVWYQDIDDTNARADYISRVDYDGDWVLNNNWENIYAHPIKAFVYWSVIATSTHWFVTYTVYHPRDWSDICLPIECHENDMEGIQLAVRKDGSQFGRVEAIETIFHLEIKKYFNTSFVSLKPGVKNATASFPQDSYGRPLVFIEAKGHGVKFNTSVTQGNGNFPGGDGVVYRYRGTAEEPQSVSNGDRDVSYALLPISSELWNRRSSTGNGNLYDKQYRYKGARCNLHGSLLPGAFDGENYYQDSAKPPWGWADSSSNVLLRGDWAIDPAYTFSLNYNFARPFSVDYLDNFYSPYNCMQADPNAPTKRTRPTQPIITFENDNTNFSLQEFSGNNTYQVRLSGRVDRGTKRKYRYRRILTSEEPTATIKLLCGNFKVRYLVRYRAITPRGKIRRRKTKTSAPLRFMVCEN